MKTIRFYLIMVALMVVSMTVAAQNPYPEEDDPDDYPQVVKFAGQKPTISDFVNAWIGDEPEDELTGQLYEMWQNFKKNKPLDKNRKVTVDAKNGFATFEITYPADNDYKGGKTVVEMVYWNCSDNKHKIFAVSTKQWDNGKAVQTEFGGVYFGIYNNETHKIHYNNGVQSLGFDKAIKTGKEGTDEYPVITYDLPRVGKDIKAIIHYDDGTTKELLIKWTGMKFEIPQ